VPQLGARVAHVGRVELRQPAGDDLGDERGLVGEAPVDRRLADPRGGGDGLHAHAREAALGQQCERGRLDRLVDLGVERAGHRYNITLPLRYVKFG
jgi:hypothetical protein